MCRLRRGYKVDTLIGQSSRFGRPCDTSELRESRQSTFSGCPHLRVWLDAEDGVAIFQQQARPKAGTKRDIGDQMLRHQATLVFYRLNRFGRISGAVKNVVFYTIGKPAGSVGSRHWVESGKIFHLAR